MRALLALVLFLFATTSAFAECAIPTGYKRLGSSAWRITEGVPGSYTWERLPRTTPADIPAGIKSLALNSTGIAIHIQSNSDALHLCWDMSGGTASSYPMWSETGASGIDVYYRVVGSGAPWTHVTAGSPSTATTGEISVGLGTSANREFLIYTPSHRRIALFRIDIPTAYSITPGTAPAEGPLVVLGTSIDAGSGTSRAGIAFPQALGRHYGVDTLNLGFVGSCQMPVGMATMMATVNASAFYLDCFANMSETQVDAQLAAFITELADSIPSTTPILLMEGRYPGAFPRPDHEAKIAAAYSIYLMLKPTYPNLYWIEGEDLLGADGEALIDDSHPSGLGHYRYTQDLIAQVSAL